MPEKPSQPNPPFDVRVIHQLVRLMKRYDLTAVNLVEGSTKINLRRRTDAPVGGVAAATSPVLPVASAPPPPLPRPEAAPAAPPPAAAKGVVIESPMVGTYYASSAPDAPPFVTTGTAVRPDTTVCVIEAMKVFTDIPAGVSGTITEVLVKNGQSVEFGQPLFRVQPS